ncbi:MAG: lipoyl synthase [Spirochaetes bacterium GWD1_61_31]|nr:MAG: lipoyl synthase [Spirochaetes bacterium GWB1_60_80]OHD43800.1 MAG: lipoyl synthase [Spirochaetes bacterium GWD1_61_31]OHD46042.1 MAG: lipoyl synthase [Spirochaetes bacterium GWE1_60_18]OHD60614.1 MAG: lipoyl synthase [Spirochaetes bacterium GWF1_60_12]
MALAIRKPAWLKVKIPQGPQALAMSRLLRDRGLHTVCDEAACPNKAECWGCGTATFMVLGDVCTRGCRFCAVATAKEGAIPNPDEPQQLAAAIQELKLKYAVLTSVDRDDLSDRGAAHFAACIRAIRQANPTVEVEVLTADYRGAELATVLAAGPTVLAHNVETVRRLQGVRDARASFDLSLQTLAEAHAAGFVTKSSLLLGLGETADELLATMRELRTVGCDILVLGQYLQPSLKQVPVLEYLSPQRFDELAAMARAEGFSAVVASPLARTSYHASAGWRASQAERQPG